MNDKKNEKADSGASPGAAAFAKNNKMFFIGILAFVLVFQAVLGIVIVRMATARPAEAPPKEPRIYTDSLGRADSEATDMGQTTAQSPIDVVVNIAGTDGERFLKAQVVLEYADREMKKGEGGKEGKAATPLGEAITQRIPKFKGFLIDRLSKMTLQEISAPEAKDLLRKDFMKMANASLPQKLGDVKNVYFTEFIIQ